MRYFWLAVHRTMPSINVNVWKGEIAGGDLSACFAAVNHAVNRALPARHRPELAADGTHILKVEVGPGAGSRVEGAMHIDSELSLILQDETWWVTAQ